MVGSNSPFTIHPIGQLASEICTPAQSKTVGGINGNADEPTNWDGKRNVYNNFAQYFTIGGDHDRSSLIV